MMACTNCGEGADPERYRLRFSRDERDGFVETPGEHRSVGSTAADGRDRRPTDERTTEIELTLCETCLTAFRAEPGIELGLQTAR